MTRDEWSRTRPVLTRALFLSPQDRRAVVESAFVEEAIRRELLELLRRTESVLPRVSYSHAGTGASEVADAVSGGPAPELTGPPLLAPGESLAGDRFVVVRQIGRGGMGEVYLAHDKLLGNLVALKVLYRAEVREAQHARLVSGHPHIVTMHDVFDLVVGDRPCTVLVMEYVAGKPASRVVDDGPLDLREAVRCARHVAAAMAHAHDRGVLHCDLKPANILITPDEGAKVLDFGIGRATFERANPSEPLRGTAEYMAPEQLLERQFSEAGDVYSLGVTLFELVTGRRPFEGSTPEVLLQIVGADAPRASALRDSVPASLDDLLARALAKDPNARYRTARALDRALAAVEWELTTNTSPLPLPVRAPIPPPPRPGPWLYVGRTAIALLGLTILGFVSSTALDSGLERSGIFRESPAWWPVYGAMALTAPLLLTAAGAILVAILAPLLRAFLKAAGIAPALGALSARITAIPTSVLAQALLMAHLAALAAFVWYYAPVLDAITSFISDDPGADISGLSPRHGPTHNSYRQTMTILLALSGFAWYRVLRRRRELGERGWTPALLGGALALAVSLLMHVAPHRLIYLNDSEQVQYGEQPCSLVGSSGSEVLLFCPLAADRSLRVPLSDAALVRSGVITDIFLPLNATAGDGARPE